MSRLSPSLCLLAAAAALAPAAPAAEPEEVVSLRAGTDWRQVATEDDRTRLRGWRDAWMDALAQTSRSHGAAIAAGGALFEPDTALQDPQPPPGDYACRTIKLGSRPLGSTLNYVEYPAFRCRITEREGRFHFSKLTGSQRPVGTIFPDNGRRMIFLGTLVLGDETRALRYSRDRERDLIGIVERVGPGRWRIAFPRPHFESLLDVIELTPVR